jgi:hypothetical protein
VVSVVAVTVATVVVGITESSSLKNTLSNRSMKSSSLSSGYVGQGASVSSGNGGGVCARRVVTPVGCGDGGTKVAGSRMTTSSTTSSIASI